MIEITEEEAILDSYYEALSRCTDHCIYEDEEDYVECFNPKKKHSKQCDECAYYIYYIKNQKC